MPLSPGAKLGPYEIIAPVGAGGMGEVYQARDTRLERSVAIKVVGGASGFEDREGIEREARAVAALNHPHICALHDVGRDAGAPFLVMEFVDGTTLAERLARGPLPPAEVIRSSIQIAEALDHAHRHGVVHRDLKPSNIMLTRSGVKVLDFGLATLRAAAPLHMPIDGASTAKHQLTSERTLLGTVHYMAPERLEGREADAKSDVFALGAVMYEMATGHRPFESGSPAGVIAAILRTDPPAPSTLQPDTPEPLDWIILKCLAKNPEARWQSAGDLVEILRWVARQPRRPSVVPRRRVPMIAAAAAALLVVAALAIAAAIRLRPGPAALPALAFSIQPPEGGGFTPTPSSVPSAQFALSPDGRRLAFVASVGQDPPQLWVRALDVLQAEPVSGTHGAEYPFWSPDSTSIGFFANGMLKRVDLSGGPPRTLAAAPNGRGGAWSHHGLILFAPNTHSALYRVSATGGEATPLTELDAAHHEASHRWPAFLPDDRHFIYFVQSTAPESDGIYLTDLDGASPRRVVSSGLSAAYVPPDHLLFVSDNVLMGSKFDWDAGRLIGNPFPVVSPVTGSSNFYAAFSASDTGLLAYSGLGASAELVWFDVSGRRLGAIGPPAEYVDFRLGPNDMQLAVAEVDAQNHRPDLRVLDLARGAKLRLTYDPATDASPIWSPDGTHIVFRSNRNGVHDLYQSAANGAGQRSLLLQSKNAKYPTDWMPDGRTIVYHTYQRGTGSDIWVVPADGSKPSPLVQTAFDEMQGQVSPDGRWLAYTSVETGRAEVNILSLTDTTKRWQVSAGGTDPRWRGDSRELFYISADSWMTAVGFDGERPTPPRRLFQVKIAPPGNPYLSNYDVTNDGRRFLLKVPVQDVTSSPIQIVTNWLNGKGV